MFCESKSGCPMSGEGGGGEGPKNGWSMPPVIVSSLSTEDESESSR